METAIDISVKQDAVSTESLSAASLHDGIAARLQTTNGGSKTTTASDRSKGSTVISHSNAKGDPGSKVGATDGAAGGLARKEATSSHIQTQSTTFDSACNPVNATTAQVDGPLPVAIIGRLHPSASILQVENGQSQPTNGPHVEHQPEIYETNVQGYQSQDSEGTTIGKKPIQSQHLLLRTKRFHDASSYATKGSGEDYQDAQVEPLARKTTVAFPSTSLNAKPEASQPAPRKAVEEHTPALMRSSETSYSTVGHGPYSAKVTEAYRRIRTLSKRQLGLDKVYNFSSQNLFELEGYLKQNRLKARYAYYSVSCLLVIYRNPSTVEAEMIDYLCICILERLQDSCLIFHLGFDEPITFASPDSSVSSSGDTPPFHKFIPALQLKRRVNNGPNESVIAFEYLCDGQTRTSFKGKLQQYFAGTKRNGMKLAIGIMMESTSPRMEIIACYQALRRGKSGKVRKGIMLHGQIIVGKDGVARKGSFKIPLSMFGEPYLEVDKESFARDLYLENAASLNYSPGYIRISFRHIAEKAKQLHAIHLEKESNNRHTE
ncbi:hypothetical protein BJ508DRAFT_331752 [Ascobolus immersus RN42]|uniref:Uncharacterized protein n=1 Tax=Ascobolus immersus RN42 TaxID=1160509 RepID=A0A3N4HV35_ASCIM|nr:hypothetical protein BJ508DRAFT_331752 [Ascobolus immersus RN42]